MKHPVSNALGGAALALSLAFAPMSAQAYDNILTINATIINSVCGNSNRADGSCLLINPFYFSNLLTIALPAGDYVEGPVYGRWDGSSGPTVASGNVVNLESGELKAGITGGDAESTDVDRNATASVNEVNFSGANRSGASTNWPWNKDIYGGLAKCTGNCIAEASGNTVSITGGRVGGTITLDKLYGGFSGSVGTSASVAAASNNRVSITSGTVENLVINGGLTYASGSSTASGNTVEIGENANIGSAVWLFGGTADISSNNTLILRQRGVTVEQMCSFQNLDFHVPADLTDGGSMLSVNGSSCLALTVSIEVAAGSMLDVGDRIVLIDAQALIGNRPDSAASLTPGYAFSIIPSGTQGSSVNQFVVEVTAVPSTHPGLKPVAQRPRLEGMDSQCGSATCLVHSLPPAQKPASIPSVPAAATANMR
ncbi:MAG: hypothetical protein FWD77_11400 [Betaproteobacteria bacterium]|nr:hypothetical protein [Betaproteobacteria bacterium]